MFSGISTDLAFEENFCGLRLYTFGHLYLHFFSDIPPTMDKN